VSKRILILNGPNLNFLGIREPEIYGRESYESLLRYIEDRAKNMGLEVEFYQSNSEGALIDRIQQGYREGLDGCVFNPGAYTHYSYALRDAVASVTYPFVEVHLSEVKERESFRHISVIKEVCLEQVTGLGFDSYIKGLEILNEHLKG